MTGTAAPPFTAISPSTAALEWAKRTAEEFASGIDAMGRTSWAYRSTLPVQVEDALGRLYAPGLPDLIEEYDHIVRACAPPHAGVPGVGWDGYEGISTMRAGTPVRALIDRCDDELKPRLALWLAINARHPRHAEVDEQDRHLRYFSRIHCRAVATLFRAALPWDSALLSLLMHAEARGVVGKDSHIHVCEQVADPVLAPCVEQLEEHRVRCQERGEELFHYGPDDPWPHARGLLLLLRLGAPLALDHVLPEGDLFGDLLREREPSLAAHPGLAELFVHLLLPPGPRPTREWREGLQRRLAALPEAEDVVRRLVEVVLRTPRVEREHHESSTAYFPIHVHNIVNGLVWAVREQASEDEAWSLPLLERIAVFTGTGSGGSKLLRSERTASTCVRVLAARGTDEAVAALARIRAKVKKKTLARVIDKALNTIADRLGVSGEQLLERTVPDFGLGRDGTRTDRLGEHPVTMLLKADGGAALGFVSVKGRPVAGPPAALRGSHPDEVKALRAELKELRQVVTAERVRLEGFLAQGRVWDAESWVRHYLDHPVTGALARRLLWEVSGDEGRTWTCGLPESDGAHWRLVDPDGVETAHTATVDGGARVRLWHPARSRPEMVHRWREYLTDRELAQPFKQAYREIYLLTPAEEATRVYSNRYAAHILKYGQAKALLNERGWSVHQLGGWHGGEEGTAERLCADRESGTSWQVDLDIALPEEGATDPVRYCGTDQVRFRRAGEREAVALVEVPALVLSEAMRDVDLAVGVSSIAADPRWVDQGESAHRPYWHQAAFGELTENAVVRREALAGLLPRLGAADRLEIDGRFLRVRGDLRSYRIHLGSANILMEPDDSYLCVVPSGREKGPGVFLPFEQDGGRLALILSKALMLAKDSTIEDVDITRQIRRGLDG
ncbi:DUF4132 domain-containing protein [Nocardiopsis sp. JB363]|uniref:DUF4132 domain-containing protein n=1 Tax=Nocardiopsis sp. JB363 TaxID=1434837 RepID=UPI00097A6B94|nr:DUF4132 domain-containing protein [Nocardiopsis sp. JB363]SIO85559.1 hypothetical protein BQ8420_07565 [Nocardiopsis sp. JB363]